MNSLALIRAGLGAFANDADGARSTEKDMKIGLSMFKEEPSKIMFINGMKSKLHAFN